MALIYSDRPDLPIVQAGAPAGPVPAESHDPSAIPADGGSLHERRRMYVTREIERAALRLFGERGFDRVSVDDVAAATGMSQRTFFRYFASKDEVLLHYYRRIHDRLLVALAARPADEGAVTALRNAWLATSSIEPSQRETVLLRFRVLNESPVLGARARGERAARNNEVALLLARRMGVDPLTDPGPAVAAAAMSAVASWAWEGWLAEGGHGDPCERMSRAMDLLMRGLAILDQVRPADPGQPTD